MTARTQPLIELHCDDPSGCDEVWAGGAGAPLDAVRGDAVAAGWLWASDAQAPHELHWCPGPHEGRAT